MSSKKFIGASVLTMALMLGAAGNAIAAKGGVKGPPSGPGGVDLTSCDSIPTGDYSCEASIRNLCTETELAGYGVSRKELWDGVPGFQRESDHDSLVSKAVSAAIKASQGKYTGEEFSAESKIESYGLKLDKLPNPDDYDPDTKGTKPKISTDLQEDLNELYGVVLGCVIIVE